MNDDWQQEFERRFWELPPAERDRVREEMAEALRQMKARPTLDKALQNGKQERPRP